MERFEKKVEEYRNFQREKRNAELRVRLARPRTADELIRALAEPFARQEEKVLQMR
ncbi:MAG: hypothetical protein ACI4ST_07055 [Candidatus Gallimonas sp.]